MYIISLIPPNPDFLDTIILSGYRKKHVEQFRKEYFENWEWHIADKELNRFPDIQLNTRGKPNREIVTVHSGCADYDGDKVIILDYDNLEGI